MVGGVVRSMEVSRSGLPAARLREPRSGSEGGRRQWAGAPRARGVLPKGRWQNVRSDMSSLDAPQSDFHSVRVQYIKENMLRATGLLREHPLNLERYRED